MSRVTGRHTRPKKLTPKQNVHIFREDQIDPVNDFDANRGPIETGVEKAEESVSVPCPRMNRVLNHRLGVSSATSNQSITKSRPKNQRCIYPDTTYHIQRHPI